VFIFAKYCIASVELWAGKDFQMIAVGVKGKDNKFAQEIVGIYGAPNEDMRVIVRLATQTDVFGNSKKRSITGSELNMPYTDWNGNAESASRGQVFTDRFGKTGTRRQ
jgi:hypothetical protein